MLYPGETFVTWFPGEGTLKIMIKFTTGWRNTKGTRIVATDRPAPHLSIN